MRRCLLFSLVIAVLLMSMCVKVKHEMTIQPVHVTVEIRVKIDRELEDFFGDIDKASQESPTASQKASTDKEKENEKK